MSIRQRATAALFFVLTLGVPAWAQRARKARAARSTQTGSAADLAKLREDYIKITEDYKLSLTNLLVLYEDSARRARQRLEQAQKFFAEGLITKRELEANEGATAEANKKVADVRQQIAGADTQIADTLVEMQAERQMAKVGRLRKGGLIQTTSYISYNGATSWSLLSDASKVETFFQQKFGRPLPIAVFGQGAIHDRWRLDHHNAMDVSLNPDDPEGQALINFLRASGIPFSAFRTAILGVATGPHIHIGLPSHRY